MPAIYSKVLYKKCTIRTERQKNRPVSNNDTDLHSEYSYFLIMPAYLMACRSEQYYIPANR
jgi:hypothetical protein